MILPLLEDEMSRSSDCKFHSTSPLPIAVLASHLDAQWFTSICPCVWMSEHIVVVVDELPQLVSQILHRHKVSEPRYLSSNNSKPDLYLVHPRGMLWDEVEMDTMQRVA